MAEKVTLRISSAAATYVRGDTPKPVKLKAARGEITLAANDLVVLLFYLSHDPDAEIKVEALKSLRQLPESLLIITPAAAQPVVASRLLTDSVASTVPWPTMYGWSVSE